MATTTDITLGTSIALIYYAFITLAFIALVLYVVWPIREITDKDI